MDYIDVGTTAPNDEPCVQVNGNLDYFPSMQVEAKRYHDMLRTRFADFNLVVFKIKCNSGHDFGTYLSLQIVFDDNDRNSIDQAFYIEKHLPSRWDEEKQYSIYSDDFMKYCIDNSPDCEKFYDDRPEYAYQDYKVF